MKKLVSWVFLFSLVIISCKKESSILRNNEGLIDHYLTINVGDNYEACYQKLQDLYNSNRITNFLYAPNDGFQTIDSFNSLINLYSKFYIVDNSIGNDTIVFAFKKDTLQWMFNINEINTLTGAPIDLQVWPVGGEISSEIRRGDSKEDIYLKLVKLRNKGALINRLHKIIYAVKDLSTVYDSYSANSKKWSVIEPYNNISQWQNYISIYFDNGAVIGIDINEIKIRALN